MMTPAQNRLRHQLCETLQTYMKRKGPLRVPEAGRLLWGAFVALCSTRTHGAGPNPISYFEIEAYARIHRLPLQPEHVEIIRALDRTWLGNAADPDTTADGLPIIRPSTQKLTPEAFDAVFG